MTAYLTYLIIWLIAWHFSHYSARRTQLLLRPSLKAAAALFHQGKVKQIIANGGNYTVQDGYNELAAMRDSLTAYGVPDSVMILDNKGTRTLNSILQAKMIFGIDNVTIISQTYHNERALYLANHYGMEAVAYNATTPDIWRKKLKNGLREYLARVKMFIDLVLTSVSD